MRKSKFLAFVSVISCIALLSSIALIPTPAAADTTEDLVLYSNDFQSNAGVTSNSYVKTALQYESSSIFTNGYNSTNQYLTASRIPTEYIKTFTKLSNDNFNSVDNFTKDELLATKQTFRFNLAQCTRNNTGGAYAAVYCYWYKNEKSYQEILIGKYDASTIGVWIGHEYEGYENYYSSANTKYSCNAFGTTAAPKNVSGALLTMTPGNADDWYTCELH